MEQASGTCQCRGGPRSTFGALAGPQKISGRMVLKVSFSNCSSTSMSSLETFSFSLLSLSGVSISLPLLVKSVTALPFDDGLKS